MIKIENNIKNRFIFLIVLYFFLSVSNLFAEKILFDNKGTDFWLAFLPNFHNNLDSNFPSLNKGDSLYIFIVAEEATTGKIEYKDRSGTSYTRDFTLSSSNEIFTFKVSHQNYEVTGYNKSGTLLSNSNQNNYCERIAVNSFHVTSEKEITVYAHSQAVTTSEAFLVLPSDVLGKEYLVLTYHSDGDGYILYPQQIWQESDQSTPSQFLIVAVEDNTEIVINSASEFHRNGSNPINTFLNQGDVFLVQARVSDHSIRNDLSGTEIYSDKPIAVFAGHQRATIPVETSGLHSRDCLMEQMLPIKTWGKNAFIIPYITPAKNTTSGNDLYRVLFALDDTDLYINGYFEGRYDRGEVLEKIIQGPVTLEASNPIMVAEYKKTSQGFNSGSKPDGDPFMMIVPPKEQFMDEYMVINTQAYEMNVNGGIPTGSSFKVYNEHYIAIVAENNILDDIKVDGVNVNRSLFHEIPASDYYYANIQVSEGPHHIKAGGRIGVYAYGYGYANSYGYTGGLSMQEFDFKRPTVQSTDSCYRIEGMVYDSSSMDTKLGTVIAGIENTYNVDYFIEPFTPYIDSVYFEANLENIYADGSFEIIAVDSVGLDTNKIYEIPGFTVALDSIGIRDSIIYFKKSYRILKDVCEYFNLQNYGKFVHEIEQFYFQNNSDFNLNIIAPFTILREEEIPLEICFRSDVDTVLTDTLVIADDCGSRALLILDLEFKGDREPPLIELISDTCLTTFSLTVTDSGFFDWGIANVAFDELKNCEITTLGFTDRIARYSINVIDPYFDAIYVINSIDSVGNTVQISDTIQGFTLSYPQFDDMEKQIEFGLQKVSDIVCDTLELRNYGILPFVIDDIYVKNNLRFSIPAYQFPIIIQPDGSELVNVCFHPDNIFNPFNDTLVLVHNCLSEEIELLGEGDTIIHFGDADCGVRIKTTTRQIDTRYYLSQTIPNPALSSAKIEFNIPDNSYVEFEVYNTLGSSQSKPVSGNLNKGYYELNLDVQDFPSGTYFYLLKSEQGVLSGRFTKQ